MERVLPSASSTAFITVLSRCFAFISRLLRSTEGKLEARRNRTSPSIFRLPPHQRMRGNDQRCLRPHSAGSGSAGNVGKNAGTPVARTLMATGAKGRTMKTCNRTGAVQGDAASTFDLVRFENRRSSGDIDRVAAEKALEVRIEGRPFSVIMRTPDCAPLRCKLRSFSAFISDPLF